jgi:hypothetical protein
MMNRSLSARLAKLEAARLVEPIILHFDDGKTKTPMIIQGAVKNFLRIVDAIPAYNNASPRFMRGVFLDLYLLCRAARIEGRSAQLFSLARALALGPAPTPDDPNPEVDNPSDSCLTRIRDETS